MPDDYYRKEIRLTDDHRKLAGRLVIRWDDEIELGGPAVDFKRPFGNSDMPDDVAEILNWERDQSGGLSDTQVERARQLHYEMGYVLKAALRSWVGGLWEIGGER